MFQLVGESKLESVNDLPQSKICICQRISHEMFALSCRFVVLEYTFEVAEEFGQAVFAEVGCFLECFVLLVCIIMSMDATKDTAGKYLSYLHSTSRQQQDGAYHAFHC